MRFMTFLLKNLIHRSVRTALTVVGIAIAIGTMIALLGITDGFERAVTRGFLERGEHLIVQQAGVFSPEASDIAEAAADRVAAMPEVEWVASTLVTPAAFPTADGSAVTALVQGWPPERLETSGFVYISGEPFTVEQSGKSVVLVGERLAEALKRTTGETMEIDGEPFEILAVIRSYSTFENMSAIMPLEQMQRIEFREGRISGFSVRMYPEYADDRAKMDELAERINELKDDDGRSYRLAASRADEYIEKQEQMKQAKAMILLTSTVAILLGTVGVLNTMVMSVVERQREISVLRAIGWRKRRIMSMILGESLLLCFAGAVVGSGVAWLLVQVLTALPMIRDHIPGSIAPHVFVQGFALSLLVGLLGGLYPAIRASRVLPSVGLRHE